MSRSPSSASGPLSGRRVLLVVGGGIAAYKALDLIRRLRDRGAAVRPLLTESAQEFITPLAAAALAGERTHTDLFDRESEAEIGHIRLARDADAIVVAPATANMMARMATGHAPDLAATVLLATTLPILIAPAMNVRMWLHPATQRNLATLKADGVTVVGPNEGAMAEAEFGPGRLAEPHEIADALEAMLAQRAQAGGFGFLAGRETPKRLAGRHVLVTSGPTHEAIDPVRYLANRSSGRQGHAVAAAAAEAGARVTLVSGPVALPDPAGVTVVRVESAREMLAAVEAALPADLAIFAAAVGDWRPAETRGAKIKKDGHTPAPLTLVENPDILATISARTEGRPPLVVGFAAETDQVLDNARKKIARKGCDLIVANDVSAEGGVMGGLDNTVHLVARDGGVETWPKLGKEEVGRRLVARFSEWLAARPG
ncbi:bifunctional phosphopantothenoylcysteine decarboxylase/phosphopantothenate--cysteine ligase CoaBC [Methylorubrum salsuginis]|uniref:Coenzyme A biosynthesis bifunctional protein CoaBC n=1 Tax=Methylorubrum salsuginis TaxID=414703 RepID=A0A1I3YF11_9HYPH|nr:bifunctional phosphopantothenoylcysteine decarboxylase/phosphopantothenate--cysteine ligase CoaBC [Methylorubrum salsuginis]SFK30360.1 phosphopantothenoylcysteine decarboxylase / phosphopantothenate--cysteine ligase [Methylorubrum salsuginis]